MHSLLLTTTVLCLSATAVSAQIASDEMFQSPPAFTVSLSLASLPNDWPALATAGERVAVQLPCGIIIETVAGELPLLAQAAAGGTYAFYFPDRTNNKRWNLDLTD